MYLIYLPTNIQTMSYETKMASNYRSPAAICSPAGLRFSIGL